MKISSSMFLVLIVILWPASAWADIDQRCLNLCVANGDQGSTCLPKCSYEPSNKKSPKTDILNPANNPAADPHNVLEAPKPMGGEIVLQTKKAKPSAHSKDYVCLNDCLQKGGQYDLCSKSCTRTDCSSGDARCTDLLGGVTSALPSTPAMSTNPPLAR